MFCFIVGSSFNSHTSLILFCLLLLSFGGLPATLLFFRRHIHVEKDSCPAQRRMANLKGLSASGDISSTRLALASAPVGLVRYRVPMAPLGR